MTTKRTRDFMNQFPEAPPSNPPRDPQADAANAAIAKSIDDDPRFFPSGSRRAQFRDQSAHRDIDAMLDLVAKATQPKQEY